MPGVMYRRQLSRSSAHRTALLRNLVTSLITHESISTTYAKAKEASRQMEKLITLSKKNTTSGRAKAEAMVFTPHQILPKVYNELAARYATRPGGYTRVLRSEAMKSDHGDSAILCLVDGPRDVRFHMTARTLLREKETGRTMNDVTAANVRKVTRFRDDGEEALTKEVERLKLEKRARNDMEQRNFEKHETRYRYTNDVSKRHHAWRKSMGPGHMIKRRITKGENDDFDTHEKNLEEKRRKYKRKGFSHTKSR